MAAASYHPRILIPKYGQTGNVKPLTANRGLPFAVRWQTSILRSLVLRLRLTANVNLFHVRNQVSPFLCRLLFIISTHILVVSCNFNIHKNCFELCLSAHFLF